MKRVLPLLSSALIASSMASCAVYDPTRVVVVGPPSSCQSPVPNTGVPRLSIGELTPSGYDPASYVCGLATMQSKFGGILHPRNSAKSLTTGITYYSLAKGIEESPFTTQAFCNIPENDYTWRPMYGIVSDTLIDLGGGWSRGTATAPRGNLFEVKDTGKTEWLVHLKPGFSEDDQEKLVRFTVKMKRHRAATAEVVWLSDPQTICPKGDAKTLVWQEFQGSPQGNDFSLKKGDLVSFEVQITPINTSIEYTSCSTTDPNGSCPLAGSPYGAREDVSFIYFGGNLGW